MLVVIAVINGTIGALFHSAPFWKDCCLRIIRKSPLTVQVEEPEEIAPLLQTPIRPNSLVDLP
jgi:hypothetical protein